MTGAGRGGLGRRAHGCRGWLGRSAGGHGGRALKNQYKAYGTLLIHILISISIAVSLILISVYYYTISSYIIYLYDFMISTWIWTLWLQVSWALPGLAEALKSAGCEDLVGELGRWAEESGAVSVEEAAASKRCLITIFYILHIGYNL